jgi:hypothetical protein
VPVLKLDGKALPTALVTRLVKARIAENKTARG